MIATTNLPKPDEIKHQIPKPDLPKQKSEVEKIPVIDLESWQGTETVPNQIPKTTPKRANESMKQFLKNHKKKSTSPKNRAGPSKLNEGPSKTKVQRLKENEVKATSDADSWDSDFYQNCKNASQDKNQVTKSRDEINFEGIKDQNLEKDSSSSSLIKDTSGNLFDNSEDDFDSENDEDFLELTRTKIEPSEVPEKTCTSGVKNPKEQQNAVIVIDSGRFS